MCSQNTNACLPVSLTGAADHNTIPETSTLSSQVVSILGDDWGVNVLPVPVRTTLISTISVLIIVSNVLNMVVLRMTDQIPTISRKCLLNLSLADMLVGVVSCLPSVYPAITGEWPYGDVWCQIAGITHGVSVTMSIWSLAFISIDRYIAILHPLRYHVIMTPSRCHIIILCLWAFAIVTFFVPLLTKPNLLYYQFSPSEMMCGLFWEYPWFCVITAVYIPVLAGSTLVFTTCRIVRTVRMSSMVVPHSARQEGKVSQTNVRALKVMIITATTYFTAWGPYVIEVVLVSFFPSLSVPSLVRFITIWMANSNSFMNVIIYSAMYSSFRSNCFWIFRCGLACVLRQPRPDKPLSGLDPGMYNHTEDDLENGEERSPEHEEQQFAELLSIEQSTNNLEGLISIVPTVTVAVEGEDSSGNSETEELTSGSTTTEKSAIRSPTAGNVHCQIPSKKSPMSESATNKSISECRPNSYTIKITRTGSLTTKTPTYTKALDDLHEVNIFSSRLYSRHQLSSDV